MSRFGYLAVIYSFLTLEGVQTKEIYDRVARVYGEFTPSYATVKFRRERQSLEYELRSGQPVDSVHDRNIKAVEDCVMANWQVSIHQMTLTTSFSETFVKQILHECLNVIRYARDGYKEF